MHLIWSLGWWEMMPTISGSLHPTITLPPSASQVLSPAPIAWFHSRPWRMVREGQWCQWIPRKGTQEERIFPGDPWGGGCSMSRVYPHLHQLASPLPNCLLIFICFLFLWQHHIHTKRCWHTQLIRRSISDLLFNPALHLTGLGPRAPWLSHMVP